MKIWFSLLLIFISLVSCNQNNEIKTDNNAVDKTNISSKSNKYNDTPIKIDTTEYAREVYLKAKRQLESQGLDFCDTYKQINDLIEKSSKIGDRRYPDNQYKSNDYGEHWFNEKFHQLLKRNGIPDSTGNKYWSKFSDSVTST
ncbi:hypothetical protein ACFJIV_25675 [Mucilaginibacter sp. UC70_90]